ncbi:OmpA family protein [Colwellia sp. E150_009]|jgi:OOP family OmpA-OmpF porin
MKKLLSLTTVLLTSPLLFTSAFANEQPLAEDLVGKFYGGAHLLRIDTDSDRKPSEPLRASDPYATSDHGSGFGGEIGYRFNESTEFRFSASQINLDKHYSSFDKPYVAGIDALYFPTQQNFYVLGGLGYLDIGQEPSVGAGAGYRHYLNERTAIYFEGKGHFQFSGDYKDTALRLGFIYFFGDESNSYPVKKERSVLDKAAAVGASLVAAVTSSGNDADNDGVSDKNDQCANTPVTDKVDEKGCTIFSEEIDRVELIVNFDNNKAIVKAQYLSEIQKMANVLKNYPELSLVIEGHTSKVGSAAYNQKISQQRAEAVVDVLVNRFNVSSDRLTAVGHGEERLIDLGDTSAAHAKNRRIEAKVELSKKVPVSR